MPPPADEVCEVIITAPDPAWLVEFTRRLVTDRLCASGHNVRRRRAGRPRPAAPRTLASRPQLNAETESDMIRGGRPHDWSSPWIT
jgi:hypothetical protein